MGCKDLIHLAKPGYLQSEITVSYVKKRIHIKQNSCYNGRLKVVY